MIARSLLRVIVVLAGFQPAQAVEDVIWVEGEAAGEQSVQRHNWYDSIRKEDLSGQEWISHFAPGAPPVAEYEFRVPKTADYHFWVRANPIAGARLSYRLAGTDWREVDMQSSIQTINIAVDGKPDMRFISWIPCGQVRLSKGMQRIDFKFHSPNNNHGGLDCFVFTVDRFLPRGSLKPGERSLKANPGFFAWEPDRDPFSPAAILDLSYLNERVAGENGRITAQDEEFALGNGRPVKFWGVNIGGAIHELDAASRVYLAKQLAKRGVNLVRIHGGLYGPQDPQIDPQKLDHLHHMVWALKQEGIYTKLSFYFPAWYRPDPWHVKGDKWPFTLLFFDKEMQRIYYAWAETLLTTANPYTKLPLGEDPALAILEIQNEDSHFFWTFDKKNVPPPRWEDLEQQFAHWAESKHGSLSDAYQSWQGVRLEGDDPQGEKLELLSAWHMTGQGLESAPGQRQRVADQVQFLTENMRSFYKQAIRFFSEKCGYKGLVSCGNWRTADPAILGPLEQYCYTVGDVIDHHGYFDHGHKGEGANWSVRKRHEFSSQSALSLKQANPLPYVEVGGHPNMTSEIGWPMPNMFRAEWPFLSAAYGSLNGLDAICHFSLHGLGWDQNISKFPLGTPVVLGSFYATALAYRQGYIAEGPPAVRENIPVRDLFNLEGSSVFARPAFDQLRAADLPSNQAEQTKQTFDPMMFYMGRVTRYFDSQTQRSLVVEAPESGPEGQTIVSLTEELKLDYQAQLATVDTAKVQGAAGFLKDAGRIRLSDVIIESQNAYGTVLVVSLDDRPLVDSEKILIQCMTLDQTYGWETSQPGGLSGLIRELGSAPWGIQEIEATVILRHDPSAAVQVTTCDENGYAKDDETDLQTIGNSLRLQINRTSPYTVLMK